MGAGRPPRPQAGRGDEPPVLAVRRPHDRSRYRIGVLREVAGRGGSAYVHDVLRPGHAGRLHRPPQPLPARAGGDVRLHRRRHRHHPDPADGRAARRRGRPWTPALRRPDRRLDGLHRRARGVRRPGHAAPAGRARPARPRRAAGHAAARHPGLLLRPRAAARAVEERTATWPSDALHLERFAAPEQPARDPAAEHEVEVVLADSGSP